MESLPPFIKKEGRGGRGGADFSKIDENAVEGGERGGERGGETKTFLLEKGDGVRQNWWVCPQIEGLKV